MTTESVMITLHIILADDDIDDRSFFEKALKEIPILNRLTMVNDGEELMNFLHMNSDHLPDVLFLDLSMPRKTGFECLSEIKEDEKLKVLPVIMLSTSFPRDNKYEQNIINMLYTIGAMDYIRKPGDYQTLKQVIQTTLIKVTLKDLG
jgi:CheY-like chemotaxis protein